MFDAIFARDIYKSFHLKMSTHVFTFSWKLFLALPWFLFPAETLSFILPHAFSNPDHAFSNDISFINLRNCSDLSGDLNSRAVFTTIFGGNGFLQLDNTSSYRTTIVFMLDNIDQFTESLEKVSVSSLQVILIVPYHETLNQSGMKEMIIRKLGHEGISKFNIDSSLLLVFYGETKQSPVTFNIWEVYSIKNAHFVIQVATNMSDPEFSVFIELESRRVSRRQDWNRVDILAVPFMESGGFDGIDGDEHVEIKGVSKFEVNVWKNKSSGELQLKPSLSANIFWDFEMALNFTGKVMHPFEYADGFSNVIEKHGHEFDIIISHFTLAAGKLQYAHTLEPTYFNGITAFFIQPPVHAFRNIYTTPFTVQMWAMILFTWVVIGGSLHAIRWVRRVLNSDELDNIELGNDEQVTSDCFWWAVAACCQQGWYTTPKTTPPRIVFATGLLFSLVCYAAYSATIVSQLWDTIVPIRNIEALITNSKHIYVQSDSDIAKIVVENLIQRHPGLLSKIRRINSTYEPSLSSMHSACVLNWPEYFIDDAKEMLKRAQPTTGNVEVEYCQKFSSFPYKYIPVKASMFINKGSPFREIFNFRIVIGLERGLLRRYWNEYQRRTGVTCLSNANVKYALGIYDTWPVFAILTAGYASSFVVLIFEMAVHRRLVGFDDG